MTAGKERLSTHRWNILQAGNGLRVCFGQHEKDEPCEYKLYVPAEPESPPAQSAPIDMVLYCPHCGLQHIDDAETGIDPRTGTEWVNPPHRSHLCRGCGYIWRPADVATNGVAATKTRGKADSERTHPNDA